MKDVIDAVRKRERVAPKGGAIFLLGGCMRSMPGFCFSEHDTIRVELFAGSWRICRPPWRIGIKLQDVACVNNVE